MNKTIPTSVKKPEQGKTMLDIIEDYKATPKKVKINVKEVAPNFCICRQLELMPPIKGLILPDSMSAGDELILEVLMVGVQNSDYALKISKGDLIIAKDSDVVYFKPTTKLEIDGFEIPLAINIDTGKILYKVQYEKV